jgi:HSP20 family molecular chaperone IbpA
VFAVDTQIAKQWRARPFLALLDALPVDPASALPVRTTISAVEGGAACIIFREGRLTTTGSLMKVYEGPALIAERTQAALLRVRIDGVEDTPFSRLMGKMPRRWFPRIHLRILPGRQLTSPAGVLSYGRHMAGAHALGRVGVLLPTSTPAGEPLPARLRGRNLYDTGDIVEIDGEGFVTIKGRATRFATVAGGMVPLGAVEHLAAKTWPAAGHAVVAPRSACRTSSCRGRSHSCVRFRCSVPARPALSASRRSRPRPAGRHALRRTSRYNDATPSLRMRPLNRLPISSDVGDVSADVRRLFEDLLTQRPERRHQITGECLPLLDVFETHDALDLLLDLPGVSVASIRVLVKAGVVIIAGEKDRPEQGARGAASYHLVERDFGRFARAVRVHVAIDAARATATLTNGELRVRLPKIEERRGQGLLVSITTDAAR